MDASSEIEKAHLSLEADGKDALSVGSAVLLLPKGSNYNVHRGVVRFIGTTEFSDRVIVGVELIDAWGLCNGTIRGKKYFQCAPGRGIFLHREDLALIKSDAAREAERKFIETEASRLSSKSNDSDLTTTLEASFWEALFEKHSTEASTLNSFLRDKEFAVKSKSTTDSVTLVPPNPKSNSSYDSSADDADLVGPAACGLARPIAEHISKSILQNTRRDESEVTDASLMQIQSAAKIEDLEQQLANLRAERDDLKELCDMQEEELEYQREQGEVLSALLMKSKTDTTTDGDDRKEPNVPNAISDMQKLDIRNPDSKAKVQSSHVSASGEFPSSENLALREELDSTKMRLLRLEKEKEASEKLQKQYDSLCSTLDQIKSAHEERLNQVVNDYEEALSQLGDYKNRIQDELDVERERVKELELLQARISISLTSLDAFERERYEHMIHHLQTQLLEIHRGFLAIHSSLRFRIASETGTYQKKAPLTTSIHQLTAAIDSVANAGILDYSDRDHSLESRHRLFNMSG